MSSALTRSADALRGLGRTHRFRKRRMSRPTAAAALEGAGIGVSIVDLVAARTASPAAVAPR